MSALRDLLFGGPGRRLPENLQKAARRKISVDPLTPVEEAPFVAFDTELTGLDPKRDSIISIGGIRLLGGRIFPGQTFHRLVRPETELRSETVVVHGLTHSDLEGADSAPEVLVDFLDFLDDAILLGHFVHIDIGFVSRAMKSAFGTKLRRSAVDTASLHEWLLDNDPALAAHHGGMSLKKDLFSTALKYGVTLDRAHDALFDALVAAQLFQRFLGFLSTNGVRTVKELLQVARF